MTRETADLIREADTWLGNFPRRDARRQPVASHPLNRKNWQLSQLPLRLPTRG